MELVTLTIDGKTYQAPKGMLLLEFCASQGIEIPNFCYYPDLASQAACRMCLVRIEKVPKLATACTVTITDGMVVAASSDEVIEARKGMLDFILGNHPLDCPVCDKGGQCELQDMAFRHGAVYADYNVAKNAKEERRLSPFIAYDEQRCVKCYRCVRVCEDWMDVHALTKIFRGTKEVIGFYGQDLHCEQCGNCVEVCPVGALLSVDSRFKARPWDLHEQQTTCSFCADGCQLKLGVRGNKYVRATSKDLTGVNGEFLCVKGRYGSAYISNPARLTTPLIRHGDELKPASWDDAVAMAARLLGEVHAKQGGRAVAVVGSPRLTNEANFALARFGRALDTPHIAHFRTVELGDFYAHLSAPLATHDDIKRATTIVQIGGDPTEDSPLTGFAMRYAKRKYGARILVVNQRATKIARRQADIFLHVRPDGESAVVRALFEEAALDAMAALAGVDAADLRALREAVTTAERLVVIVGREVRGAALRAVAQIRALTKPDATVRLLALADDNNSAGAFDMGLTADAAQLEADFGRTIQAAYFAGADPITNVGDRWGVALARLQCLVVSELFMTETAKLAHVVFPAMSYAEQDGTFTNHAGQVQRVARVVESGGTGRPDWLIVQSLARAMRLDVKAKGSAAALLGDIATEVPGYAGVSFAAIKQAPKSAYQLSRPLTAITDLDDLCAALREQTALIDAHAPHDRRIVVMGEGLFARGTLLRHVKVFDDAQPFWAAHRGEWEMMNLEDDFAVAAD
ncbi:MAG: molybdopterin-dependent oxidoreductase [Chloracidobacterium sp.]|nr:molybdopterin-dependent oxidoreductase [Chloracidobacterium sp.]MDW8217780.1 molybdopterin-dependent oxidoreductase [Acidobacteriota bacterium]